MPNFTKKTSYSILSDQPSKKIDAFFKEIQKEADIIENSINERERQLNSVKKDESKYRELLNELSALKNELFDADRAVKIAQAKNYEENIKNRNSNSPTKPDQKFLDEVFDAQNKLALKDAEYKRKQEQIKNLRDSGDLYPDEVYKKEKEHIEFVKKTYKNVVTIFHKLQLLHDKPEKTRKQLSLKFKPDLDKLIAIVKQAAQTKILNNVETTAFNDIIAKATKLTKTYAVISSVLKSSTKKFGKGLVSKFSNAYVESAKKSSMFGRVVFSFMGVDKEKISDLQIESESLLDDDYDVPTSRATKVPRPTDIEENTPNNKLMRREAVEGEEVPTATPENIARKALDTETLDAELIKEPIQPELPPSEGQKLLPESSSNVATRQGPVSPQNSPIQPTLIDNTDNSDISNFTPPTKSVGRSSTIPYSSFQNGGKTASRVYNNKTNNPLDSTRVVQLLTSIDSTLKSILAIFKRAETNTRRQTDYAEAAMETAEETQPDISSANRLSSSNISGQNLLPSFSPDSSSSGGSLMSSWTNAAVATGTLSFLKNVATRLWSAIPLRAMLGVEIAGVATLGEILIVIAAGYALYKISKWAWDNAPDSMKPQPSIQSPNQNEPFLNVSKKYYDNVMLDKSQHEEAERIRKEMENVGFDRIVQDYSVGQAARESNLNPRAVESFNFKSPKAKENFKSLHKKTIEELNIDPEELMKQPPMFIAETLYGSGSAKGRAMGNTEEGEGWKYRGRGGIQLTGKSRYIEMGKLLGIDLENNPDLAATPEWSAKIMAQYYKNNVNTRTLRGYSTKPEDIQRRLTQATIGNIDLNSALGRELLEKSSVYTNTPTLSPTTTPESNISLNQTTPEQEGRKVLTDTLANQSKEPAIVSSHVTMQNNNVTNVNNGGGGSANGRGFIKSPLDESSIRLVLGH